MSEEMPAGWRLDGMRVGVLMGGPGSEREVSLASGAGVLAALRAAGAVVETFDLREARFEVPPGFDIFFNVVHGTFGEDGALQRVLESAGVAYTGEGPDGSELAFDKIRTRRRFSERGIPGAAFEVVRPGEPVTLPLPLVVKAPREGSSVGVYIVREPAGLAPALADAARFADEILIESFFSGRELTVGILGDRALPIVEIRPKSGFYDFRNKYPFLTPGGGADHFCPAPLDEAGTRRVQQTALAAHRALGLEVYSRVDVLLGEDGSCCVLEINTLPGMTPASLLPEAAAAAGISYPELCARIIRLSLARKKGGRE
jgi:D-alanine-D-alanine ligase